MIIDFRVRVPNKLYQNAKLYKNILKAEEQNLKRFGVPLSDSAKQFSMELFWKELSESGIDIIVVPVRKFHGGNNEDLVEFINDYPNTVVGLIGLDPSNNNFVVTECIEEIQKYVVNDVCSGIVLEPGQGDKPWNANDERVFPIYEYCQANNIPIAMTFGGISTKSLRYYQPELLDDVANLFPNLKITAVHGGWPYITEISQIVLNRKNIYLAPDFYMMNSPGCQDYIMGANYVLQDRIIFSSAYPLVPIKVAKEYFLHCGICETVLPKILYENAKNFLNLNSVS